MGPDVVTVNEIPQIGKVHWQRQTIQYFLTVRHSSNKYTANLQ